ncbi:MAG: serine hydrolase [Anaerolineales bacterium]|nr:serine hydrolase [Anaerolineales bacterium]
MRAASITMFCVHRLILAFSLAGLLTACAAPPATPRPPDYWPTAGWRTAAPADHGLDAGALAQIPALAADKLPYLDSVLIIRNGYLVHEAYFNGYDAAALHDVASVTKSWTSAIIGRARADGHLADLEAPLSSLLPEYFTGGRHADKAGITLRHLLQMRSGLEWDEDTLDTGGYGTAEELLARDLVEWLLSFPMTHAPGEAWNYNTGNSQLLSAVFQRAVGRSLADYAEEAVFAPLGIERYEWLSDGHDITLGGQNLRLTPRDMAKLGLLYLHGGQWEGRPLIPADWVTESTTPQGDALYVPTQETLPIEFYGYHWWLWHASWFNDRSPALAAQGYAGQNILILPRLNLIIITTANLQADPQQANRQRAGLYEQLILGVILPAVK